MAEENKMGEMDVKADYIPVAEKANFDSIPLAELAVPANVDLKASPLRFLVCLLLSLSLALNGYILTTYVTIWFLAMDTYSVDSMAINMFSIVYAIFYIPGSIISIALYAKYGLSKCTLFGAVFNFLCCWIRVAGSYSAVPYTAYAVMLFGQIFAAIGQPSLLNAPPRVANDWFPSRERDIAMHVMTQAQNIGGGLGAVIPAYQVLKGADIPLMLVWQGVASTAILILTFVLSPVRPPIHAEFDAEAQDAARASVDRHHILKIYEQMLIDFKTMLNNRNFVLLLAAFSVEVGVSWVFMAVVGQMIYPCNYDVTVVGGALAGLSFAGVVGSFCIAWVLRQYKYSPTWYLHMQKLWFILAMATGLWCLGMITPNKVSTVVASWMMYGFITSPLTPITLEHAAEITYPIPADNSAALLFTGVNMVFLAVVLGVTPLLTHNVSMTCASIISPSSALLFFFLILGGVLALPMSAEFKRMAVNEKMRLLVEKEAASDVKQSSVEAQEARTIASD